MIFRWLYRRRLRRLFGRYIRPEDPLWQSFLSLSEWQAFKSFLPDRWVYTDDQIAAAHREIARKSAQLLHERDTGAKE